MKQQEVKYKGLTKKQYKRQFGSSTPGSEKGENCKAKSIDKAIAKYPRSHKTMPDQYFEFNLRKDRLEKRRSFFTKNACT